MALTNTQTNVDQLTINVVNTYSTFSNMSINENELYFIKEDQGAKIYYATCATAADQFKKVATIEPAISQFTPEKGTIVAVKYNNTNTANASAEDGYITLNINNTGDKNIYYNNTSTPTGTSTIAFGYAGRIVYYMYDGTYWVWMSHSNDNNTTYSIIGATNADSVSHTTGSLITGQRLQNAITNRINQLEVSAQTGTANKTLTSISEANGKISNVVYSDIAINADQVTSGTFGSARLPIIPITKGGTNANSAANARTNLGVPTGNARIFYGTCATAAGTEAKVVACSTYTPLTKGDIVFVTFDNTNSGAVANLTLNVNSTGAKPLKCFRNGGVNNLPSAGYLVTNQTYQFYYDGTNWVTTLDYNSNTDTKVNVTLKTTTKAYLLGTSVAPTATASAVTTISDTGVYLDTTAGKLTATSFSGDGTLITNVNAAEVNGYTVATNVPSTAVFTDTDKKVQIDNTTTSNWRKVLLSYSCATSQDAAVSSTTSTIFANANVEVQPSTGTLKAKIFSGDGAQLSNINGSNVSKVASATVADSANAIAWANVSGRPSTYTPASHTHGSITNDGKISSNVTIANGDRIVITDNSASNVLKQSSIYFDGSTTTKFLSQKGTWVTPSSLAGEDVDITATENSETATGGDITAIGNNITAMSNNSFSAYALSGDITLSGPGLTQMYGDSIYLIATGNQVQIQAKGGIVLVNDQNSSIPIWGTSAPTWSADKGTLYFQIIS